MSGRLRSLFVSLKSRQSPSKNGSFARWWGVGCVGDEHSFLVEWFRRRERPLKRPARIRRCHPAGEIIAEFQAVASSWSGERTNSLRRRGLVKRQSCKCHNRIIHSRRFRSVSRREIAIEGVADA